MTFITQARSQLQGVRPADGTAPSSRQTGQDSVELLDALRRRQALRVAERELELLRARLSGDQIC
jgi:hypothetical protein